jgi:hypothetical protein
VWPAWEALRTGHKVGIGNTFGTIAFNVNFSVASSGQVAVDPTTSSTKGYPSIEGFAYKIVQGQLIVEILFTVQEQDPNKLKGQMDVPLVPPQ